MDNFIQITVVFPPEPRVGAFVYRNAGKIYSWSNWNLEVLVFFRRGNPEYWEKNLLEHRKELVTNSSLIWR